MTRLVLLVLLLSNAEVGCRAWRDELDIKSEHECVEKKCTNENPATHEQCVDQCHRRFKP